MMNQQALLAIIETVIEELSWSLLFIEQEEIEEEKMQLYSDQWALIKDMNS